MINKEKFIFDVEFDFTSDTPYFWDNYWDEDNVLGTFNTDPDSDSKTLQHYHKLLWSKQLPNGEYFDLKKGYGCNYLTWKNMRFGSDSITASFRYKNNRKFIELLSKEIPNYHEYVENYMHQCYTIGGSIIFPKHKNSINQVRGCNYLIRDRWDLTLECIRRYYNNEDSPLYNTLKNDKDFFDLFGNFRNYIDFFFLQDCVTNDYSNVIFWLGKGDFSEKALPKTVQEYLQWIDCQLNFVKRRNTRINNYYISELKYKI